MKETAILIVLAGVSIFSSCNSRSDTSNERDTRVSTSEKINIPDAKENGVPYFIDAKQSEVKWHARKVTGEHNGTVAIKEGSLAVLNNAVIGGTVVLDMTSITNTDITDRDDNLKLVRHLKSDDFFSVEKYPIGTFTFNKTTPILNAATGQPNFTVEGTLTLKDKTDQIQFPAYISATDNEAKASANVTIDRTKFDVRYGSTSFFDNLGDKAISNDITIMFDITARP